MAHKSRKQREVRGADIKAQAEVSTSDLNKRYDSPQLARFGSIRDLTQSGTGFGPDLLFASGAPGT